MDKNTGIRRVSGWGFLLNLKIYLHIMGQEGPGPTDDTSDVLEEEEDLESHSSSKIFGKEGQQISEEIL